MSSMKIIIVPTAEVEHARIQLRGEGYVEVRTEEENLDVAFAEGGGQTTGLIADAAVVIGKIP